jgi:hypothetical protein
VDPQAALALKAALSGMTLEEITRGKSVAKEEGQTP